MAKDLHETNRKTRWKLCLLSIANQALIEPPNKRVLQQKMSPLIPNPGSILKSSNLGPLAMVFKGAHPSAFTLPEGQITLPKPDRELNREPDREFFQRTFISSDIWTETRPPMGGEGVLNGHVGLFGVG